MTTEHPTIPMIDIPSYFWKFLCYFLTIVFFVIVILAIIYKSDLVTVLTTNNLETKQQISNLSCRIDEAIKTIESNKFELKTDINENKNELKTITDVKCQISSLKTDMSQIKKVDVARSASLKEITQQLNTLSLDLVKKENEYKNEIKLLTEKINELSTDLLTIDSKVASSISKTASLAKDFQIIRRGYIELESQLNLQGHEKTTAQNEIIAEAQYAKSVVKEIESALEEEYLEKLAKEIEEAYEPELSF